MAQRWQVGDRIADRYEIYQILGGGMGIVYVCYDHEFKEAVALKTFQEKYLFSEEAQRLFEREALLWTELERYPYIVRANCVERLEGRLFILLEYIVPDIEGRNTLTHYLGNLTLPEILRVSIQFCYGMEYAYSKGIDAHRDIKPDNIMITQDKIVKITDFGLAKALQEIELKEDIIPKGGSSLSIFRGKQGRICGTPPYMAPEQFDGNANKRSDVYAFGIVLYQMAADGRFPFYGETVGEYEKLHRYDKIPSISSPLFPIIERCLEKEPDKRYQYFADIKQELQNLLLKETGEIIIPPEKTELEAWELGNKGIALLTLGKYQEALSYFDKVLKINPRDVQTWSNKGTVLVNLGRVQESLLCYDKALEINPKYATAWFNKGFVLGNLDRHQEAIPCFDRALEINPRFGKAWSNKGIVLVNLGMNQEAISCYNKALEINPKFAETWCNKGVALVILGKFQEALECAKKAVILNPNLPQAHQLKQMILQALGGS